MTPKGRQITTNCHHASACSVARMGSAPTRWTSTASRIAPATRSSGLTNLTVHIVHEEGSLALSPAGPGSEAPVAPERRRGLAGRLHRPGRAGRPPAVLRDRLRHAHVDPGAPQGGALPAVGAGHRAGEHARRSAPDRGRDAVFAVAGAAAGGARAARA